MRNRKEVSEPPVVVSSLRSVDRVKAEQATGCVQNGKLGNFYEVSANDDPPALSVEVARAKLEDTIIIAVPNAGAGSYKEFFRIMGFKDIKVIDWSSSAGDWVFGVQRNDGSWVVGFQNNRYPRCGFTYSIQPQYTAGTFEVLCNSLPN